MKKITKSPIVQHKPNFKHKHASMDFVKEIDVELSKNEKKLNWRRLWLILKQSPTLLYLLYKFIRLKMSNNDKKTTRAGWIQLIIGILVSVVTMFGLDIPNEIKDQLIAGVVALVAVINFYIAKLTNKKDDERTESSINN